MRPGCGRPAVSRLSYDTISCQVWLDPVPERPGPAQEICELHTSRLTVPRGWVLCDRRGDAPALFVTPAAEVPSRQEPVRANGTTRHSEPDRPVEREARRPRRRVRAAPAPVLFESPVEADDSGPAEPRTTRRNGSSSPKEPRVAATAPVAVDPMETVAATPAPDAPAEESEPIEQVTVDAVVADPVVGPDASEADDQDEELLPTSPLLARAFRATGPQRSVLTQTLLNEAD